MLLNPPPGDWLHWRRTYDSHGFTPLTQINRNTVKNLRTAWTWNLAPGMNEVMALVINDRFHHHGNPVAEYCFDTVEARVAPYNPDLLRPDKPQRDKSGKRIDAVPVAAMAASAWHLRGEEDQYESPYEKRGVTVA